VPFIWAVAVEELNISDEEFDFVLNEFNRRRFGRSAYSDYLVESKLWEFWRKYTNLSAPIADV
jgi:hypothetical protein